MIIIKVSHPSDTTYKLFYPKSLNLSFLMYKVEIVNLPHRAVRIVS